MKRSLPKQAEGVRARGLMGHGRCVVLVLLFVLTANTACGTVVDEAEIGAGERFSPEPGLWVAIPDGALSDDDTCTVSIEALSTDERDDTGASGSFSAHRVEVNDCDLLAPIELGLPFNDAPDERDNATPSMLHKSDKDQWSLVLGTVVGQSIVVESDEFSLWKAMGRLNGEERVICLNFLIACGVNADVRSESYQAVERRFGPANESNDQHNDNTADAIRHCVFSGRMAQGGGSVFARQFGNAHENVSAGTDWQTPGLGNRTRMDLFNNDKGIEFAEEAVGRDQLVDLCLKAACRGDLKQLSGTGDLTPSGDDSAACKREANAWGDPHLSNFDGLNFDFQGVGEFVLLKTDNNDVEVQIRTQPVSSQLSVTTAASANVSGDRVSIYSAQQMDLRIDGVSEDLLVGQSVQLPSGGSVTRSETQGKDTLLLAWPDGSELLVIEWTARGTSYLNLFFTSGATKCAGYDVAASSLAWS